MNTSRTRSIRDHKQLAVGDLILKTTGEIALVTEVSHRSIKTKILNAESYGDSYAPNGTMWIYNKWLRNSWRLICK